jgi:hypothetical protein
MSEGVTVAGDVSEWAPWTPRHVVEILSAVDAPWYVAGGWAIDLFLGHQRREHGDLEIAVPRSRFDEVADALADFELYVVKGGNVTLVDAGSSLDTTHQTWVRDPAADRWRLDVFREPSSGDAWVYRRDERIRSPYERVIRRTADGIPYGSPEVILLFKAPHAGEEKHQGDFEATLLFLDAERRAWLIDALELVHDGHPWIAELRSVDE